VIADEISLELRTSGDDDLLLGHPLTMLSLRILKSEGKVEAYAHETGGVRQDGVFIGSGNVTTWGFRHQPASECESDYYEMRLLGRDGADPTTGEPLRDGEFKGFLKVEGA
jgi:hypothetical protein